MVNIREVRNKSNTSAATYEIIVFTLLFKKSTPVKNLRPLLKGYLFFCLTANYFS